MIQGKASRCALCGKHSVIQAKIDFRTSRKHENVEHEFTVRQLDVEKCDSCGEIFLGADADLRIRQALREKLGLLQSEQLKKAREALDMRQEEFAAAFGFATESICHWERGRVQSRSSDLFMRVFFAVPEARQFLLYELPANPKLGEVVLWPTWRTPLSLVPSSACEPNPSAVSREVDPLWNLAA